MIDKLLPGDKVFWYRMNSGLNSSVKIPAEVAYWTSKGMIAIKVTSKDGQETFRYVPLENLERA